MSTDYEYHRDVMDQKTYAPVLSDGVVIRIESSPVYIVLGIAVGWTAEIGTVLMGSVFLWSWWKGWRTINWHFWFWIFVVGFIFCLSEFLMNAFAAWLGLAPPDHSIVLGPKQVSLNDPKMEALIMAQHRGTGIMSRGIYVEELLKQNERIYARRLSDFRENTAKASERGVPRV
jgi:hypothetical protein